MAKSFAFCFFFIRLLHSKLQTQLDCFAPARNTRLVASNDTLRHFPQAMRSIAGGAGEQVPPQKENNI